MQKQKYLAFMLDLQNAGWQLAFTPDSIYIHGETEENLKSYNKPRKDTNRKINAYKYLETKYGLNKKNQLI
jgi:hypothetical protein